MTLHSFYVEKKTGTSADTTEAFGLADFCDRLIPDIVGDVGLAIEDAGDCYIVSLQTALSPEWITEAKFFPILPALNTKTKTANIPLAYTIDYLEEQGKNQQYFEARSKGLDEEQLNEQGFRAPLPDWPVWAVINQMSATASYNKLVELWYAHQNCFPSLVELILEIYTSRPNNIESAAEAWTKLAKEKDLTTSVTFPQLQVVNPGTGKGGNRSKADGLGIGGLKSFWLTEYLKFVGFYQAAIPRVIRGEKDRKTYVLQPKKLRLRMHKTIFPQFQKLTIVSRTAVQMDVLMALNYCRVFLEQWLAGQGSQRRLARNANPGNHVAAIETTYYRHLGSAHATMNLSSLAIPLWMGKDIETKEEAQQFLDLLAEHSFVIRRLDEKRGDEYNLLLLYRNFLSGRDLQVFYRFTRGYSKHLMSELAKGNKPPQFSISNLEVLIMAHDEEKKLAPILQNEGFRNVAQAIRRSTVIPQGQKARGRDSLYEIRYGLGDKLLRHAQYKDEFIQELSRFMHDYNRENARKLETRKQQFRSNLTMDDIEAIVTLIDEYKAPTVANLLVAFGYARDPNLGKREEVDPQTAVIG